MKKVKILPFLISLPFIVLASGCNGDNKVSPTHQRHFHDEKEVNTLREVEHLGEKVAYSAPTTGNTRVFVVPIEFKDYPADEIGKYYNSDIDTKGGKRFAKRFSGDDVGEGRGREAAREDIRKVYFGSAEDTQWHSLRSYYEASSYGSLHFEGLVADWFRPYSDWERPDTWATAAEWASGSGAANALATQLIDLYGDETTKKYAEFKDDQGNQMFHSGTEFLQYFDSDHDGCFDLIEIVYSAPFYATDVENEIYDKPIDNDIFWAYCGSHRTGAENVNRPTISKYAFFSYYTFVENGTLEEWGSDERKVSWTCKQISEGVPLDAHTLIHETGHALGLPDFYDTSYSGKNASGSVDMMDHNVGDHNSYSKTQLGWVDPIVVTGPTLVTVKSFTETGECIMVPYRGFYKDHPEYGNSTFIEYMAIELYTPTGVNKQDSEHHYAGNYPKCPSIAGIKMYHVDSRLGVFTYNGGWKFIDFTEKILSTGDMGQVSVASTNSNNNHVEDYWQLQFLSRDESSSVTLVSNEALFQAGDTFNSDSSYANFKMNECYKDKPEEHIPFGYKITIQECSANSATILFEAN